jgi:hypothetical protein
MPIIQNKRNGKFVIREIANATYSVANVTLANTATSEPDDVVGMGITELYWTGEWTVKRGANTILVLSDGQDNWIFDGDFALREYPAADIVITAGSVAGTIILVGNKYRSDEPLS